MEEKINDVPFRNLANGSTPRASDEALVSDARAGLTPSQMVERKLMSLLNSTPLPMSRLQPMPVQRPQS
jgi:hypothetical protein